MQEGFGRVDRNRIGRRLSLASAVWRMSRVLVCTLVSSCLASGGLSVVTGQSLGSAGTVTGTVVDQSNAVVTGATATIENAPTQYKHSTATDETGAFRFDNVPPNNYDLAVSAKGFATTHQLLVVKSSVPLTVKVSLSVSGSTQTVDVQGYANVVESDPAAHADIDAKTLANLPTGSPGGGLNDAIALLSPGVARDSNNFYHPLGDHAQASIAIDNQVISDQKSKAFSTQIPEGAIQSMEIITTGIPAEFGDKTSLVINAITKSGLGQKRPTGSFSSEYGTFGTFAEEATFGFGGPRVGNFVSFSFERSGRFLDPPEFTVLHDRGNTANIFDRLDFNLGPKDTFHLNVLAARNNFQIPNQFDQEAIGQDQHQLVRSINIALGWVHTFNTSTLLSINPYYRLDQVWYFPSANPFSDQTQTISQQRRLGNLGIRADLSYSKGIHNIKVGFQGSHTFLTEAFQFGITDPNFNDPASDGFLPGLAPFDLTRGGHLFTFNGHTDIKQEAVYVQDSITLHQLTLSLGVRFDNYNGIVHDDAPQPRLGAAYLLKKTNTVFRFSYSRTFETPYNENLILSSATGAGGLADNGVLDTSTSAQPLRPGRRNLYSAGFQQGFGRYILIDGSYFWKYTQNAYDFNAILNTPITFPIAWHNSKIDGFGIRASLNNYKGLSVNFVAGHARARYFPPETGGLFFNSNLPAGVFRIDHDQAYQQTTVVQYQFNQLAKVAPYVMLTWRYDSGLVAGSVPDFATALTFTPDQQAQIGLFCGGTFATPTQGLTDCASPNRGATRVRIPADGTENDDTNPPRIAPRHLFDLGVGTDNLFRTERARVTLRLSAINLTNKDALYNFLSTFSGTHFVSPRTFQVRMGVNF